VDVVGADGAEQVGEEVGGHGDHGGELVAVPDVGEHLGHPVDPRAAAAQAALVAAEAAEAGPEVLEPA
jgi:hypothetical protein